MEGRFFRSAAKISSAIALLICIVTIAVGCDSLRYIGSPATREEEAAVADLLQSRSAALNRSDLTAYRATVCSEDQELLREESNLLLSLQNSDTLDFSLSFSALRNVDGKNFSAYMKQTYRDASGHRRTSGYYARFVVTQDGFYYAGPYMEEVANDSARVQVPPGWEDAGREVLERQTSILDSFRQVLGFEAERLPLIKLYSDQEVFRQSITLDLPAWVGGWHEAGESIKLLMSRSQSRHVDDFLSTLRHETTHLMVSQYSNDNAAYWLQEGLAGLFERGFDGFIKMKFPLPKNQLVSFEVLRGTDLEALDVSDGKAVNAYYDSSCVYAAFLVEVYGWEKVHEMLAYLGTQPGQDLVSREKMAYCNMLTDAAIQATIGLSPSEMDEKCQAWLSQRE